MPVDKSPNCALYTDTVSTLVHMSADSTDNRCKIERFAFSCQTKAFERPDSTTEAFLKSKIREDLKSRGCPEANVTFHSDTNIMGARDIEYSAERLVKLGMASNCNLTGNDPNQATHTIRANCSPMFDMVDEHGNRVRDYRKRFLSELSACDISDEAMPQLQEAARKVAAHNAGINGYIVEKPEHLACTFSILPHI